MIRWSPDITPWLGEPTARQLPALRDSRHVDGLWPELHTIRVEKHFGDFYGVCSCQARSLPCWNLSAAERWRCPRDEAEVDVTKAQARWATRVADAGDWGRA